MKSNKLPCFSTTLFWGFFCPSHLLFSPFALLTICVHLLCSLLKSMIVSIGTWPNLWQVFTETSKKKNNNLNADSISQKAES